MLSESRIASASMRDAMIRPVLRGAMETIRRPRLLRSSSARSGSRTEPPDGQGLASAGRGGFDRRPPHREDARHLHTLVALDELTMSSLAWRNARRNCPLHGEALVVSATHISVRAITMRSMLFPSHWPLAIGLPKSIKQEIMTAT